ncbi:enoyl-CoA hydratase [Sphingosinicella soli]|uniref:Enoyl-CoA hydratase n=1 Tax=Sphingosinicella soli TaxID=333708 RepID=A0A7W7F6K0_9SPHN|nr:enoyl-CoA hydratase [Sphingosinicella soli]MBB4631672.1 enoyl-CoA hydratase [Sphingosinicella soli]
MTDTTYSEILYEQIGAIARISHNRPAARNAESKLLLNELNDAVLRAGADADIRVIILAGVGDHFSAGHDLKEAQTSRSAFTVEERWDYEILHYFEFALRIWDLPKPVISQVQGACVAGGFMVANMCDLMVASEDAFFSDPVCQTLGTAAVEILIHPWVMGLRQAKDMLFTGRRISAKEGFEMGMVNRLVARADLESTTLALAEQVAKAPPFALRLTKRSLNRGYDMQGFRTALQAHFDTHQLSHNSAEFMAARDKGLGGAIAEGKNR